MELNDLDLNKLRTFLHVYRALSVRGAARTLHVTPPAVSMGLKALERGLRISLFTRAGRGLIATPYGDQLAGVAAPLLSAIEGTLSEWRNGHGAMRGRLRLGLPGEFGPKVVMPLMGEFRERHPDVTFHVLVREPQSLLPELLAGNLDVVICDDGPYLKRFPQVSLTPVASEDLILTCSAPFYDNRVRDVHTLDHLRTLDHVAYVESQDDLQKWYRHHFRKTPKLPVSIVADNVHAVLAAVRTGLGLGIVPTKMVEDDVRTRKLRVITTNKGPLRNQMLAIRLKDRVTTTVERAFIARLRECTQGS